MFKSESTGGKILQNNFFSIFLLWLSVGLIDHIHWAHQEPAVRFLAPYVHPLCPRARESFRISGTVRTCNCTLQRSSNFSSLFSLSSPVDVLHLHFLSFSVYCFVCFSLSIYLFSGYRDRVGDDPRICCGKFQWPLRLPSMIFIFAIQLLTIIHIGNEKYHGLVLAPCSAESWKPDD